VFRLCLQGIDSAGEERLFERLMRSESRFLLDNDLSILPPLLGHLRDNLVRTNLCDEPGLNRVCTALGEALINAIVHGNLEIDPCLREAEPHTYQALIEKRRSENPYRDRRVHVFVKELLHEARYVIRHEGRGFYAATPLGTDGPITLELNCTFNLALIGTLMDEVSHNEMGNELMLVKRRDP
jgi:hypothetical protein